VREVLEHPKTAAAMKDAAVAWVKELPGVKATVQSVKSLGNIKDVIDDVRGARAVSGLPTAQPPQPAPGSMTIQPQALQRTTPPPLPGTPVSSGTVTGPTMLQRTP